MTTLSIAARDAGGQIWIMFFSVVVNVFASTLDCGILATQPDRLNLTAVCELLAVSSKQPTVINMTLEEFQRHGGGSDKHGDGWGIAFYDENDARIIREPEAAVCSEHMNYLRQHACASRSIIAHIRQASVGGTRLENTQPFARALSGRLHTFAHNGDLYELPKSIAHSPFTPLGDTDSEQAFCTLMQRIFHAGNGLEEALSYSQRLDIVAEFAAEIVNLGIFNFLYCDGEYLFAHSHKRTQHDGELKPPGLHLLLREGDSNVHEGISGLNIASDHSDNHMALVASVPLTKEPWQSLEDDTLVVLSRGVLIDQVAI